MSASTPPDPKVQRVIGLLKAAAEDCRKLIRNPPGDTRERRDWATSQAAQRLRAIEQQLDQLQAKVSAIAARGIQAQYRAGLARGDRQATLAGFKQKPIEASFNLIDARRAAVLSRTQGQTMQRVAQATVTGLSEAIQSMKAKTRLLTQQIQALGLNKQQVDEIIASGTINGAYNDTYRKLRVELQKVAVDGKVVTVNTRTGEARSFKIDDYADIVLKTKMAEATNLATLERLVERGVDLVRIIGSHSANFCTAFVGHVFSISGTSTIYPDLSSLPRGGPPFHPRCTKRYVAFNEKLATPAEIEAAKPDLELHALLFKTAVEAQKTFKKSSSAVPSGANK